MICIQGLINDIGVLSTSDKLCYGRQQGLKLEAAS